MKILIILLLFISSSFGMDLINFHITDNELTNVYLNIFLTFSVALIPLFGALSLFGAK